MVQTKISLTQSLLDFLDGYKSYGFKDKNDMVRVALAHLREEIEQRQLKESAALYAEMYANDSELLELTEAAVSGWPE
jgi:metal-responsive CopG/Arc/MetJ family transcriptional regulator